MPLGEVLRSLTTLVVLVVGSGVAGNLFRAIGQPRVLGPIVVGIAAGTGLAMCPEAAATELVSVTSRHVLDVVGTAGLLLLMFSVGAELRTFGKSDDASVGWRALPCVVLPVVICVLAAWPFAVRLDGAGGVPGPLYVGIALGVTAVPVLMTIIEDLNIGSLGVARVALRIAVVTDGLAWILVSVLEVASTEPSAVSIPALALGAMLLGIVTAVLPRIVVWAGAQGRSGSTLGVVAVSALTGATATQFLGLHPAIGAVIAGFFFPSGIGDEVSQRGYTAVVDALLPAFFVSAAMEVPLEALRELSSRGGLACVAVLALSAVASKLAAGYLFGVSRNWSRSSSARLGVLLNCRGVTEIAIASVGFQAGVISPFAFATLCGLAIVTTGATVPLYRAVGGSPRRSRAVRRNRKSPAEAGPSGWCAVRVSNPGPAD
ncbi:cation:proton antiporter [Mycobacterium sp. WMMD1722]|uniref:cation:proton antiporter n=1 Tax=Mycobacterium sp. WMMD1722 TaxID=3404117 RepID=UPI003BF57F7F